MCMRANYLAEDWLDVRFACKEIARLMSEPCEVGWDKLKRLGRYLAGVPRLVQRMERQDPPRCVLALSDSDHAGCLRTRRSTTCNIFMRGDHFPKMICFTQVPIALSAQLRRMRVVRFDARWMCRHWPEELVPRHGTRSGCSHGR